jgi:hypothetical protein
MNWLVFQGRNGKFHRISVGASARDEVLPFLSPFISHGNPEHNSYPFSRQKNPMPSALEYPPELLSLICAYVYVASIPSRVSSLDPLCLLEAGIPTGLPSSYPPSSWSEPIARKTLANLTLVNRAWSEAARPWLWRKIEVRLPRGWLSLVEEISGGEDAEAAEEDTARAVEESITEAAHAAMAAKTGHLAIRDAEAEKKMKESIIQELGGPDSSILPELLSPPASREPSPRRLRQKIKSPARWKLLRCISDVVQGLMGRDENGMYGKRTIVCASHSRIEISVFPQYRLFKTDDPDVLSGI